jgi:cellulose synthase/poly-beta-1,6-N-acetylglucosamine synthase-like glycosyltransferase
MWSLGADWRVEVRIGMKRDIGPLELSDPGPQPDVSIIVCAYGHRDVTLDCLQALVESQWPNVCRAEVILVNDASPDDTAAMACGVAGLRLVELLGILAF